MSSTLQQLALDAGGTLLFAAESADQRYFGVSSDTRQLLPGQLYVALRGPNFDGAAFLQEARDKGAVGALAERAGPEGFPVVQVVNALQGLQRAARSYRLRCELPVIAVAGSNGKTTCKEMLAAILRQKAPTLSTRGNLNNHIGVPLTLLHIEPEHEHAVIELGANHPGEVAALATMVAPDIGIVTNAGAEHLEGFGSIEGAARAEGELFAALAPEGVAVLNADDTYVDLWRDMTVARVVTFGLGTKADYFARDVQTDWSEGRFVTRFRLCSPHGETPIVLGLAGQHNVINALGASAAAIAAGATLAHVTAGLAQMRAVAGRLQLRQAICGAWVIDDSYNANPSSMEAAIDVLESMGGARWMVLGAMGELGSFSSEAHRDLGRYARSHGLSRLFCFGVDSQLAAKEFGDGAEWFSDIDSLLTQLRSELTRDISILVKGSRSNRLERVVNALCGDAAGGVH